MAEKTIKEVIEEIMGGTYSADGKVPMDIKQIYEVIERSKSLNCFDRFKVLAQIITADNKELTKCAINSIIKDKSWVLDKFESEPWEEHNYNQCKPYDDLVRIIKPKPDDMDRSKIFINYNDFHILTATLFYKALESRDGEIVSMVLKETDRWFKSSLKSIIYERVVELGLWEILKDGRKND